jgi:hypothetical protein
MSPKQADVFCGVPHPHVTVPPSFLIATADPLATHVQLIRLLELFVTPHPLELFTASGLDAIPEEPPTNRLPVSPMTPTPFDRPNAKLNRPLAPAAITSVTGALFGPDVSVKDQIIAMITSCHAAGRVVSR